MLLRLLKDPFPAAAVHWRIGAKSGDKTQGMVVAYIDDRDAMKRFDDVCEPENWQVRYPRDGYCEIGIFVERTGGGEWIWKGNGAGETAVEGEKGRYSDAFKRAAVLWGVGRYLYYLPKQWMPLKNGSSTWATIVGDPKLPAWALPK